MRFHYSPIPVSTLLKLDIPAVKGNSSIQQVKQRNVVGYSLKEMVERIFQGKMNWVTPFYVNPKSQNQYGSTGSPQVFRFDNSEREYLFFFSKPIRLQMVKKSMHTSLKETDNPCQTCRGCCKFEPDDAYFATLFAEEEIAAIKNAGMYKNVFLPYRESSDVYQIRLVKSAVNPSLLVCPYLDEDTHLCTIYHLRPFDCRFWPFVFMYDITGTKKVWACFEKRLCDITAGQTDAAFMQKVNDMLGEWNVQNKALDFLSRHSAMVWRYEPHAFEVRTV
jgi:Fe-S-cluster containining protein